MLPAVPTNMSDKSNKLVDSEDLKVSLPWVPTTETDKDNNNSSESHNGQTTSQSLQDSCKSDDSSEDSHGFILEAQQDFLIKAKIKKNISLQNILCTQRASSCGDMVQEDAYMKFSIHNIDQLNNIGKIHLDGYYMDNVSQIQNQNHGSTNPEFHEFSIVEPINHQSIFSIEAAEQYDADHLEYADNESAKHGPYAQMSSDSQPLNAKSCYLSGLRGESTGNCDGVLKPKIMGSDSRSFENMFLNNVKSGQYVECNEATYSMVKLNWKNTSFGSNDRLHEYDLDERSLPCHSELREDHLVSDHCCKFDKEIDSEKDGKYVIRKSSSEHLLVDRKGLPCDEDSRKMCHRSEFSVGYDDMGDQERDDKSLCGKQKCDIAAVNGNDSDNCVSAVKLQHVSGLRLKLKETSVENWHGTPIEEPNSNRIDAWISQLDVQNCNVLEELGGRSNCISNKDSSKEAGKNIRKKLDASSLAMVAAYNYISALSPASSMAHMANLGLVVIPYLSAFAGLKMLNLSGNAIVRITSGVIPKGLQMLNLSKNNISVIEGLRELTRLRVLDLSHNKISRIGHGLASCSSLKELYLAGNKISEVEGLHRLLKLSILDLRSNKISASQSFRQLVANYASLQAINLEANPAQKNIGDEQLKKFVLSLLPRLAYYNNKEVNRASGSKEALSRPSRSFSSHHSDKSFNRESHRGSRISGHKSMHGYMKSNSMVNLSIKSSRSTYKPLVPLASKPTDHLPHTSRNARGPHSMRRIHSEGAF